MQSKASTPKEYIASLDPERKKAIQAIRKVINDNVDKKVKEVMTYGMLGWVIPHSVYPDGYHCDPKTPLPFINLASQKNHIGIYLFCIYGNDIEVKRLEKDWKATGNKLDMGKSCVRVKKLENVPLDVLGAAIKRMTAARFIEQYESSLAATSKGAGSKNKAAPKKKAAKKTAKKAAAKKAAKKAPARKVAAKKTTKKKAAKKVAKKAAVRTVTAKKATAKKATAKKATKKKAARKKATTRRKA